MRARLLFALLSGCTLLLQAESPTLCDAHERSLSLRASASVGKSYDSLLSSKQK